MRAIIAIILALGVIGTATPLRAERLVAALSNHRVLITSSFSGEELVVFGTVEPDKAGAPRRQSYDLVITVTGPRLNLLTRRKERVVGVWVNSDSRLFVRVPSYLSILSNRNFSEIAMPDTLRRLQIGLDNVLLPQRIGPDIGNVVPQDPFRRGFVHLEGEYGLYREDQRAVTFLTPNLFRATIPLPGNVPTGGYALDAMLFANGELLARSSSAFEIIKSGFEQYVADAARDYPLYYGLATTMMALLTGWLASIVFRRD
ncbi:MAG TPA: TIGR02186 family protein [Pseudolabrys sp.]|nr:TIGR02186 family protein [Pseudolabrys sp.]